MAKKIRGPRAPTIKPDYDYSVTPESVYRTSPYVCAQRAILWPLCRSLTPLPGDDALSPLPRAYGRLIAGWRSRLLTMGHAGWDPLIDPAYPESSKLSPIRCVMYRNCPPFGVKVPRRGKVCGWSRMCPFCYARRIVLRVFFAVDFAFYGGEETPRDDLDLVYAHRYRVANGGLLSDQFAKNGRLDSVRDMLDALPGQRGAAYLVTMAPAKDGAFRYRHSLVVAVEPSADIRGLRAIPGVRANVIAGNYITKERIGYAISEAMSYPLGLMFGKAEQAASVWRVTRGSSHRSRAGVTKTTGERMLAMSGAFRNESRVVRFDHDDDVAELNDVDTPRLGSRTYWRGKMAEIVVDHENACDAVDGEPLYEGMSVAYMGDWHEEAAEAGVAPSQAAGVDPEG